MRLGVFVDISNLYFCLSKRHSRKLSYRKLYDFVAELGDITVAIAYGAQANKQAEDFRECLHKIGFTTRYKTIKNIGKLRKADWDVGIAVDMIRYADQYDVLVLCSADSDLYEAVKFVNKKTVVIATGIARELHSIADTCIEIPESLLEETEQ